MKLNSFIIEIKEGVIVWKSDHHKQLYAKMLTQFSDGKYSLEINPLKSKRSDEQNRYYWLYLGVVSRETGYTSNELHEWAKGKFLTMQVKEIFGDKVRERRTTTKLTRGEFVEYLMEIELATGVELPDTTDFFGFTYHKKWPKNLN